MERCPCCNARTHQALSCPRCKANLSLLIQSEKTAQYWLSKSIEYYCEQKTEQCIHAIQVSLRLKKTRLANAFQSFLIQQQCQLIVDLLIEKKLISIKKQFYKIRLLLPLSKQLQQLHAYTDYLLVNNQGPYKFI